MLKLNTNSKNEIFELEALSHRNAMYGLALKLTKNEKDAEDLVQDALIKAYKNFDKYELGTNCKAWLLKIVTNAFINRYRRKQRERTFLASDEDFDMESVAADESNVYDIYSEVLFDKHVFSDEVLAAMEAIPEDFRQIVVMADLQDLSYKEIAEKIDCPIGTVMSRLFRGRKLMRKHLADYAAGYGYAEVAA
ncbi:MAG: sigma-70 family RNA polymerase sigma factor [Bradymonadales bacterium]